MLIVHHLGKSQSERIVWLCEELELPYELKLYARDPKTMLAQADYRALHPMGLAPVITDGSLVLAESGAIVEYITAKHGGGRLTLPPDDPDFAQFLYWFHFVNGSLQANLGRLGVLKRAEVEEDNPAMIGTRDRVDRGFASVEARCGEADYLAGNTFTTADIMIGFTLTTMRYFAPYDLAPYPNIRAYLARIAARPAYQRAMAKGDPGMALLLS